MNKAAVAGGRAELPYLAMPTGRFTVIAPVGTEGVWGSGLARGLAGGDWRRTAAIARTAELRREAATIGAGGIGQAAITKAHGGAAAAGLAATLRRAPIGRGGLAAHAKQQVRTGQGEDYVGTPGGHHGL